MSGAIPPLTITAHIDTNPTMEILKKLTGRKHRRVIKEMSVKEILTRISNSKVGINEIVRSAAPREDKRWVTH